MYIYICMYSCMLTRLCPFHPVNRALPFSTELSLPPCFWPLALFCTRQQYSLPLSSLDSRFELLLV